MQRSAVLFPSARCVGRRVVQRAVPRGPVTVKCCFMAASRSLPLSAHCPYRTLGVGFDANEEEIKVAYRLKAKVMHPDVTGDPKTANSFMECKRAYERLLDPEERAKYDKTLLPLLNSHQVLSHLNARSAARYGISLSRVPTRVKCAERRELRSTLLDLVIQVRYCARRLEREFVGKDGILRGLSPTSPRRTPRGGSSNQRAAATPESDCGEHECCEPWFYYAAQLASLEKPAERRR